MAIKSVNKLKITFTLEQKFPDSFRIRDALVPDSFLLSTDKTWIRNKKFPDTSRMQNVMNQESKKETLYVDN